MYICIYVMILGFLFFIQIFLKYCKALTTEKYKRYINILLLLLLLALRYKKKRLNQGPIPYAVNRLLSRHERCLPT